MFDKRTNLRRQVVACHRHIPKGIHTTHHQLGNVQHQDERRNKKHRVIAFEKRYQLFHSIRLLCFRFRNGNRIKILIHSTIVTYLEKDVKIFHKQT